MPDLQKNKVVYGGQILVDLTNDTVTPATLVMGTTAHDKSGKLIVGTHEEDTPVTVETEVTPSVTGDVITPEAGQFFDKVTVKPIPYKEEENEAGGLTVTIG